ncbi:hypothetical protein EXIGLDRAFT_702477 [Exidia glandulosa HHB12029]|uniref:Uncharacterized protein n=1 Tax=Exidia glandulosa HHB12029 TaxID=1314781 RepID=A0A165CHU1_EXIGL|nr:hypothetical protein EXIGLDRAFT_702477 [Exidia glandulosa HHB12029]
MGPMTATHLQMWRPEGEAEYSGSTSTLTSPLEQAACSAIRPVSATVLNELDDDHSPLTIVSACANCAADPSPVADMERASSPAFPVDDSNANEPDDAQKKSLGAVSTTIQEPRQEPRTRYTEKDELMWDMADMARFDESSKALLEKVLRNPFSATDPLDDSWLRHEIARMADGPSKKELEEKYDNFKAVHKRRPTFPARTAAVLDALPYAKGRRAWDILNTVTKTLSYPFFANVAKRIPAVAAVRPSDTPKLVPCTQEYKNWYKKQEADYLAREEREPFSTFTPTPDEWTQFEQQVLVDAQKIEDWVKKEANPFIKTAWTAYAALHPTLSDAEKA